MRRKSAGQIAAEKQGRNNIRCAGGDCKFTRRGEADKFQGLGRAIPADVLTGQLKGGVIRTEEVLCNTCHRDLPREAAREAALLLPTAPPVCTQHTPAISV